MEGGKEKMERVKDGGRKGGKKRGREGLDRKERPDLGGYNCLAIHSLDTTPRLTSPRGPIGKCI